MGSPDLLELPTSSILKHLKVDIQIIQRVKEVENFIRLNCKGILLNFFTLSKGIILV